MARPEGFEPPPTGLEVGPRNLRSIHPKYHQMICSW